MQRGTGGGYRTRAVAEIHRPVVCKWVNFIVFELHLKERRVKPWRNRDRLVGKRL